MVKTINLALQGGGAHGAFSWGMFDRLLNEDDLEVAAIAGTFAGALNVAAFKAGRFTKKPVKSVVEAFEAILPSACLPNVFQALEIDDPKTRQIKAAGRTETDEFLRAQKDDLGHLQTADLQAMFG